MDEQEIAELNSLVATKPEEPLKEGTVIDPTNTLDSGVNYDNNIAKAPVREVGDSTNVDYWNSVNALGVQFNNPDTRFVPNVDNGDLDIDSPEFQAVYQDVDVETKREMLNAQSTNMALKIAKRRGIFEESSRRVAQDGLGEQLARGLLPAAASITSILPAGVLFKSAQVAKLSNRLLYMGGAGGFSGAGANILEEAMFDAQGMPTNYISSGAYGFGFGAGLGVLGGALSGPRAKNVANAVDPKQDTLAKDMDKDPIMTMTLDENGIPKIEYQDVGKMEKSLIDRIPLLGSWLKSDVHTVMQGEDGVLRSLMVRMANSSVSMRDNAGNILPANKNGWDIKIEAQGIHNQLTEGLQGAFGAAKELGYKGDLEAFNKDIWASYTDAMTTQRNSANEFATEMQVDITTKIEANRKQELDVVNEDKLFYRNEEGKVVPMTEELLGTIPEDKLVFKKDPKKIREADSAAINEKYDIELNEALQKSADEWYTNNPIEFKGDPNLVKGLESYQKYFQDMLEKSQKIGIKELQGIPTNKLYLPRVYDYKNIQNGSIKPDVLHAEIKAGLINDSRNTRLGDTNIDELAAEIVTKLQHSAFNVQQLTSSFLAKDLPFGSRLKQQKLYLNDSFMPTVLRTSMEDITGAYHYGMAGRQGVQFAFGTDQLDDVIRMVTDENVARGTRPAAGDMVAFERVLNDLLGTLRMNQMANTPAWEWTRNVLSFNSARLMGGAGGNQFIELAGALMMNGTKALMSGRMMQSFKSSASLLYTKSEQADAFSKYLIASGHMEEVLHTTRVNRYTDAEVGFNSGWLENKLNWMNDKLMKVNGMRLFMGVMEDFTGGAIVTRLVEGDFKPTDLARMGLSEADAADLGKALKDITLKDWDISTLSTKQQDQLQLAISRGIEDVVVQGGSVHLPNWMKNPSPIAKMMTQFMRFPMIAQETLLRRGMNENQAQMVAGALASMTTYMGLKYMREQAAIATGSIHPIDAKYDYDNYDDDDWFRVAGEAANYTANLGMLGSVADMGLAFSGNTQLGRDWADKKFVPGIVGPSGGLAEDLSTIMKNTISGDFGSEKNLKKAKNLVPFNNLPLVKEGLDYMVKEIGG